MDAETLTDPLRAVSLSRPAVRMIVIHAWPEVAERHGKIRVKVPWKHYPVVSVSAVVTRAGVLHVSPVIEDGDLYTVDEAVAVRWPSGSVFAVVTCDWPKRLDRAMLLPKIHTLRRLAKAAALSTR